MNFMLTSLVIPSHVYVFLLLVMLLVSFDWIISRSFRTPSEITVISFTEKFFSSSSQPSLLQPLSFLFPPFLSLFSPFPGSLGHFFAPNF